MARHRAATSAWRSFHPRWAFNAVLYAALGFGSLGVIQSLGPFNDVHDVDPSVLNQFVTVVVSDVSDPDAQVRVEATVYPHDNGDQQANLLIEITSQVEGGFAFENIQLAASSLFQSSEISPLTCKGEAITAGAPTAPSKPLTFGVVSYPPDGREKPRATTILRGSERYSSMWVACDMTSLATARRTSSEVTYSIPPISVLAGVNNPPDVAVSLSRSPLDSIVTNSRPPTSTTLADYTWKTDPHNFDVLIVSVTNPDIRNTRDQSVFLWGLFAGVAAAFFVAAIQEVVNWAGRSASSRTTATTRSQPQGGNTSG